MFFLSFLAIAEGLRFGDRRGVQLGASEVEGPMTGPDAPHWWDPADCFGQSCAGMSIPITYEATVLGYAEGMKDVFMQRQYTKGLTNRATGPVRYDPDRAYRTPLGSSQNVLCFGTAQVVVGGLTSPSAFSILRTAIKRRTTIQVNS